MNCSHCRWSTGQYRGASCPIFAITPDRFCAGCSQWTPRMPKAALPVPGVSAQGQAAIPAKDRQDAPAMGKKRGKGPNKTEAAYQTACLATRDTRYEAVTFRLANGHRYTPDWVVVDAGRIVACHEVKGGYRMHSHGRARLAFDQARVEYPGISWIWAVKTKTGWECE
jgi:hypothetical protein